MTGARAVRRVRPETSSHTHQCEEVCVTVLQTGSIRTAGLRHVVISISAADPIRETGSGQREDVRPESGQRIDRRLRPRVMLHKSASFGEDRADREVVGFESVRQYSGAVDGKRAKKIRSRSMGKSDGDRCFAPTFCSESEACPPSSRRRRCCTVAPGADQTTPFLTPLPSSCLPPLVRRRERWTGRSIPRNDPKALCGAVCVLLSCTGANSYPKSPYDNFSLSFLLPASHSSLLLLTCVRTFPAPASLLSDAVPSQRSAPMANHAAELIFMHEYGKIQSAWEISSNRFMQL